MIKFTGFRYLCCLLFSQEIIAKHQHDQGSDKVWTESPMSTHDYYDEDYDYNYYYEEMKAKHQDDQGSDKVSTESPMSTHDYYDDDYNYNYYYEDDPDNTIPVKALESRGLHCFTCDQCGDPFDENFNKIPNKKCSGSCMKTKNGIFVERSCSLNREDTGCRKKKTGQICYCNEDLCNGEIRQNDAKLPLIVAALLLWKIGI